MPSARRGAAVAVGVVTAGALMIAGLGIASVLFDEDVVTAPGLGQIPGALAVCAGLGILAGVLWARLPAHGDAITIVVGVAATFLAYVLTLGGAALIVAPDLGIAAGALGRAASSWPGAVVAASALGGIVLALVVVRADGERPTWPWERESDDE